MDKGTPTLHFPFSIKGNKKRKCACAHMHSRLAWGYKATWQKNRTLPVLARGPLRIFFSNGRAQDECICPLGKVLTYKN